MAHFKYAMVRLIATHVGPAGGVAGDGPCASLAGGLAGRSTGRVTCTTSCMRAARVGKGMSLKTRLSFWLQVALSLAKACWTAIGLLEGEAQVRHIGVALQPRCGRACWLAESWHAWFAVVPHTCVIRPD